MVDLQLLKKKKYKYNKFRANFYKFDDLKIKSKVDLIKIDVEGSELNVLKGMEKTLRRHNPIVVFESQKNEIINGTSKVINFLRSKKYSKFYSIENYKSTNVNIFSKILYLFNFIFISRKKYIIMRNNFEKKYYSFIIAEK